MHVLIIPIIAKHLSEVAIIFIHGRRCCKQLECASYVANSGDTLSAVDITAT